MPKHMEVGRSWRTAAKHELLASVMGQEVGAGSRIAGIDRHCWLDLCAGNGHAPDGLPWGQSCSPGILATHAATARKRTYVALYEIDPATYADLLASLEQQLPSLGYVRKSGAVWEIPGRSLLGAINGDGREANISSIRRGDAVLVVNDPNAMTDWAMRDTFAEEVGRRTWTFRSLSTMGCNAAGIKRLSLEDRRGWFDIIGGQEAALPRHRDLLLASIQRDSAQWAYLLCTAGKWREKTATVVRSAFRRVGRNVSLAWYRTHPDRFEQLKQELFLTRTELQELVMPPLFEEA